MPVLTVGVSYRRAPVDLLERLTFGPDDYGKAYRQLSEIDSIREGVVLSTCNRVEIYAEVGSYHAGAADLKRFLVDSREVSPEELAGPLYSHYDDEATEHLFRVAAGIDSMVLGEPQILGQVRAAHRRAEAEGSAGPVLSMLFRRAIRAGRRARAETAIAASPAGFVDAALSLAKRELGGLAGRVVAVIGAGHMSSLAVRAALDAGARDVAVLNRSLPGAERLAAREGGRPGTLEQLAMVLGEADLVLSATGATGVVITARTVRAGLRLAKRPHGLGRPLLLMDLAVPRDVEPGVSRLPGVRLASIDDLHPIVANQSAASGAEVAKVEAIVAEESRRFAEWRRTARLAPLIQALRDRGESVQAAELARVAPRLSGLSPREREAVESLARGIVAKLLHRPIVKVKELSGSGPASSDSHARVLAELFGIDLRPNP